MLPYDMFKDSGNGDDVLNSNASLDLLLLPLDGGDGDGDGEGERELVHASSGGASVVRVSLQKLQEQWLNYCIEHNRPNDAGSFDIGIASRLACREDAFVVIEDECARGNGHGERNGEGERVENDAHGTTASSSETYLTEQQLRQLWSEQSAEPLGKPAAAFSVREALLLLPDSDDALLLGPGGVGSVSDTDTMLAWSNLSKNVNSGSSMDSMAIHDTTNQSADESEDTGKPETLYITAEELERVWATRQGGKWGMPAATFDERLALLLLDEDDDEGVMSVTANRPGVVATSDSHGLGSDGGDEGDEGDGDAAAHASAGFHYIAAADAFKGKEPDDGYWDRRYPGSSDGQQALRDNLKQIYRDMEDMTPCRPAWKKDRHILTPDIDTQKFEGDIMNSNTYMTKRVPANWDDPERGEMSDVYLSTGSMSSDGEEQTDYNVKMDVWQTLGLPLHRIQSSCGGRLMGAAPDVAVVSVAATAAAAAAAAATATAAAAAGSDTDVTAAVEGEVDWATFDFASMEGDGAATAATAAGGASEDPGAIDLESFFRDVEDEVGPPGIDLVSILNSSMVTLTPTPLTPTPPLCCRTSTRARTVLQRQKVSWTWTVTLILNAMHLNCSQASPTSH
jgi:hypothetical protein